MSSNEEFYCKGLKLDCKELDYFYDNKKGIKIPTVQEKENLYLQSFVIKGRKDAKVHLF